MAATSVVIPARNAARTLPDCLAALVEQGVPGPDTELIVVDDGSTDNTAAVAQQAGARVLHSGGRGPAAARNAGARAAHGEILAYLDADTVPLPDWLCEIRAPFRNPVIVAVKGRYHTRQRSLLARFTQLEFEWKYARLERAARIDYVDTGSAAFRREALLAAGGFDEGLVTSEDVELAFRLAERGARFAFNGKAAVWHEHTDRWWPYLLKKARGAYTRTLVYRRHPAKAAGDAYTPPAMGLQIALAGGATLAGALALARVPSAMRAAGTILAVFGLTTLPSLETARRHDPALIPAVPLLTFARAFAQGVGVALALLRLVAVRGQLATTGEHR